MNTVHSNLYKTATMHFCYKEIKREIERDGDDVDMKRTTSNIQRQINSNVVSYTVVCVVVVKMNLFLNKIFN